MSVTTIYSTDELALIAAIREHPDEDTPRLAYADYLDELDVVGVPCLKCVGFGDQGTGIGVGYNCRQCKGTGTVLDTSNHDRAELIRVQCELARDAKNRYGCRKCTSPAVVTPTFTEDVCCCRYKPLYVRERELLAANADRWRKGPTCEECEGTGVRVGDGRNDLSACPHCSGTGDTGGLMQRKDSWYARAGDDWDGGWSYRVEYVRGMKRVHCRAEEVWKVSYSSDKPLPYGPTDWAKRVCRHHPDVCELWIVDAELNMTEYGLTWNRDRSHHASTDGIPGPVFDLMRLKGVGDSYKARVALARAAVQWIHSFLK